MDKFKKILIVSDVDGTYKAHKEEGKRRNAAGLEYFKSRGGRFCLATGRILPTLMDIFPDIADIVNFPCILGNGTYIYDFQRGERSCDSYVPPENVMTLLRLIDREYPEAGIRITCADGTFLVPRVNDAVKRDISGEYNYVLREKPLENMTSADMREWNKIVLHITDSAQMEQVHRKCLDANLSGVVFVKSWSTLLEILPTNGTKGKMLDELKRLAGNDCRLYAVGDYDNDYEMLQMADVAVCPANAVDSLKAIADIHLCTFEEGAIGNLVEYLDNQL